MTDLDEPPDENPYAAPAVVDAPTEVYGIDSRRLGLGVYWRLSRGNVPGFLIMAACKLLGVRLRFPVGIPAIERLEFVDRDELPAHARAALGPLVAACEAEGFAYRFGYRIPVVGTTEDAVALVHQSADRRTRALAFYSRSRQGGILFEEARLWLGSDLADGRVLWTGNGMHLIAPPRHVPDVVVGRDPAATIAAHRRRLAASTVPVVPVEPEALPALQLRREQESIAHAVERGVYRPLTESELARVLSAAEAQAARPAFVDTPLTRRLRNATGLLLLAWLAASLVGIFLRPNGPLLLATMAVGPLLMLVAVASIIATVRARRRSESP